MATVLISSNMHWIIVQLQLTVARWLLWPASSRLLRNPSIGSGYRSSGLSGLWRSSHHLGLSFDFQKTFSEVIARLAPIIFPVQTVSSGDYIKMRVRLFYWAFVWSLKCVFFWVIGRIDLKCHGFRLYFHYSIFTHALKGIVKCLYVTYASFYCCTFRRCQVCGKVEVLKALMEKQGMRQSDPS